MKGSGDYVNETAGETLGEHKLVYRGADGYWYLADYTWTSGFDYNENIVSLRISRQGGHAGDTAISDSWMHGVEIIYLSNELRE